MDRNPTKIEPQIRLVHGQRSVSQKPLLGSLVKPTECESRLRNRLVRLLLTTLIAFVGQSSLANPVPGQDVQMDGANEVEFSYQALVTQAKAVVRSGPDAVHYGTQTLEIGDSVEVFRRDPNGWLAIRPLDSSFSLIPAANIKMVREGIGEVVDEDARAWVGTHLGPVEKPLWQIKLRKQERVKVIGEVSYPDPQGHSTIWYQIKPPAGEYRWIHQSNLKALSSPLPESRSSGQPTGRPQSKQQPPVEPQLDLNTRDDRVIGSGLRDGSNSAMRNTTQPASTANQPVILSQQKSMPAANDRRQVNSSETAVVSASTISTESGNAPSAIGLTSAAQEVVLPNDQQGVNAGWRRSTRPFGQSRSTMIQPESRVATSPAVSPAGDRQTDLSASALDQPINERRQSEGAFADRQIRVADARPTDQSLAVNLNSLASLTPVAGSYVGLSGWLAEFEGKLTQEMLKPSPSDWQVTRLEQEIRQRDLAQLGPTEQANAARLMQKIENCKRLQAQFEGRPYRPSNGGVQSTWTSNSPATAASGGGSNFDATGWLNELKRSQGQSQSTYVLQDRTGRITHHVEPVPGLNLSRYLKQKVGVVGRRGYHQGFKLDHVQVSRVYPLQD